MSKPYQGTLVNWAKSQTAIIKLLNSKGIYETRFTNLEDKFALEFRIVEGKKILFKVGIASGIAVRILVPFEKINDEAKRERQLNQLHRVLFYHIKAKFVAIESGVTEFMEEFMPHLVIMDKNGNDTTLGQAILPQYKKNLEEGRGNDFKLLN